MATKVVSFGFAHGVPAGEWFDVRDLFRNPHHNPRLRNLTGLDVAVAADIEKTIGFAEKFERLVRWVEKTPGTAYIGCTGGKHRSPYLAARAGKLLGIPVEHRDLKPVTGREGVR